MDPTVARRAAVRQYEAARQALSLFADRYWAEGAPVRAGFDRFLGSLDEVAGRLLADEAISRRGQDLLRRGRPGAGAPPDAGGTPPVAGEVDVTFTLPAEVGAERVALCGEFNDWATDDIWLERDGDGSWRATVALAPGRSYRYRYLVDGERWENAWHADRYESNGYGTVDSVVVVD